MSNISIGGLVSGIQWQDLIDEIIRLERRPVERLESQVKGLEAQSSAWGLLKNRVEELQARARTLAEGDPFSSYTVSVQGVPGDRPEPFSARVNSDVIPGSYRVIVHQLATAEKLGGGLFESRTEPLGITGEFLINGHEIEVDGSDTLNDLISRINAANSGLEGTGVSATAIRIAEGEYRLILTSERSGSEGIDLHDEDGTLESLGLLVGSERQVITPGADAIVEIDGQLITRRTNTIDDVVPGLVFELTSADPELIVEAHVVRSNDAAIEAIEELVEAYNDLADFVESQLTTPGAKTSGIGRDILVQSLRAQLRDTLQSQLPVAGEGGIGRLGEIGIEIDRNGRFMIDSARLEGAVTEDPNGVRRLFGLREETEGGGEVRGIAVALQEIAGTLLGREPGSIVSVIDQIRDQIGGSNRRIEQMEVRIERRYQQLTHQYAALEQVLSQSQSQLDWLSMQLGLFGGLG